MSRSRRRMILPLRVLGSSGVNVRYFGRANLPSFVADVLAQFVGELCASRERRRLQRDERDDRLSRNLVGLPDYGRFGDGGMIDERALDFRRRDAMAADVHYVIDAAHEPEVAVLSRLTAVAGEIHVRKFRPVRFFVALGIAPNAAQHRRPRALEHAITAAAERNAFARVVDDVAQERRERLS